MKRLPRLLASVACTFLLTPSLFAATAERAAIAFIGCRSDGQLGPQPAPHRVAKQLAVTSNEAQHLAYYQAKDGPGVLAPRGWHCFGTYGSNGSTICVSPDQLNRTLLFAKDRKGFKGPIVQLSNNYGGTSGRWAVGSMIARIFPAYHSFVTAVQNMGFDPSTTNFAVGRYSTDTLHYVNQHSVEYTTPPHTPGVGTMSELLADDQPITGVQILTGADTDLISLSIRLPSETAALASVITRQVEHEYTEPPPRL